MAPVAEPRITGRSSPGNSYLLSSSRTSSSTRSSSSASSTRSHLFMKTTIDGTFTCRASRMCSRVCGIGPVAGADHQDRPVHLRGPGDHVLHVVGVARAVHVRVVALRGLVLHVAGRDRQDLGRVAAALRLRGLRHRVVRDVGRPAPCRPTPSSARRWGWSSRGRRGRWFPRSRAAWCARIWPWPYVPRGVLTVAIDDQGTALNPSSSQ